VCDTLCVVTPERTLFAKNSDRPPQEAQVVEWHPRRAGGGALETQYLTLPDAGAAALLGSRPTWLWGLEHGVNEHGVAIGNEKIWTVDDARSQPPALLGMDLVRLGLERARTADDALDTMTALLTEHGQGGSGEAHHDEPYFSSFMVVDTHGGWVLETSARTWAARPIDRGAAISNRVSIGTDWTRASDDIAPGTDFDRWRDPKAPTGIADHRLRATSAAVALGDDATPASLIATLRDHGADPTGSPPTAVHDDWSGVTVCMHVRDYQATTAAMVVELPRDGSARRAWSCLGSPCTGVFLPCFPPFVPPELADEKQWHRFAALRSRVEQDGAALPDIRAELDPVEGALWSEAEALAETPTAREAFTRSAYAAIDTALARLHV
jgi:hypothetical protein